MLPAEPNEVGHARHFPIVVDDLADHSGGIHSGEAGQINGRLRLTPAFEDAARARAQRENMSWPPEIFRKSE